MGPGMRIDLVTLDLDGTLVDTALEIAEAANRALAEHGIERRPEATITRLIGAGTRELMLRLLAQVFIERPALAQSVAPEAVLASFERHYVDTAGTSAAPYPGCREALVALRDAGVPLACVTNKEARHAHRVLKATGLDGYFQLVVGGDSLPEKKPHRSVLLHVARVLRIDLKRLVHVGDSSVDVETARNAGVTAWVVPYGYNGGEPIEGAAPDRIFADLLEMARHVIALRNTSAASERCDAGAAT